MSKHLSVATTRTRPVRLSGGPTLNLLAPAQVIESPETRLQYRIDRLVGKGGFGQAYLARRVGPSTHVPALVCIKVSEHIDGWLREAYFGQLWHEHPRAVRLYDAATTSIRWGSSSACW